MEKDLIIGGASNYTWDDLKYWINSIKLSGFKGDIALVATNISKETIEKLISEGIILELYGKIQEDGSVRANPVGAPHVERFFYIWKFLNSLKDKYQFVIATDTRDVIFQSNPAVWFDECMCGGYRELIASSEGMKYEDEPWNNQNLLECFGPFFHRLYKGSMIYNVGILAGEFYAVRDLMLMIFQMSINRPIQIVDQVVYNFLLNQEPYKSSTLYTTNSDAWAVQLGTTLDAVKSGKGDLGISIASDPSKMAIYQNKYLDSQPTLREDGLVVNQNNQPFVIVHQYDRTNSWKEKILARYEKV